MKLLNEMQKNLRAMLKGFSDEQKEILANFHCDYIMLEDIEDAQAKEAAELLVLIWCEEEALSLKKKNKYCSNILYPFVKAMSLQYQTLNSAQRKYITQIRDDEKEFLKSMSAIAGKCPCMYKRYF